jgi:hypothetical protein
MRRERELPAVREESPVSAARGPGGLELNVELDMKPAELGPGSVPCPAVHIGDVGAVSEYLDTCPWRGVHALRVGGGGCAGSVQSREYGCRHDRETSHGQVADLAIQHPSSP